MNRIDTVSSVDSFNIERNDHETEEIKIDGVRENSANGSNHNTISSQTDIELMLAGIWKEALEVDSVDINTSFFDVGGDSLHAIQIITKVNNKFHTSIPIGVVFEKPTIRDFAAYIGESGNNGYDKKKQMKTISHLSSRQDEFPLSASQRRIWFMTNLEQSITAYNIPLDFKITGNLSPDVMNQAINILVARHESLRTVFLEKKGIPYQKVLKSMPFAMDVVHLDELPGDQAEQFVATQSLENSNLHFSLSEGPLFSIKLLISEEKEAFLLVNFHHIISDAVSIGIFFRELTEVYKSLKEKVPVSLPELPITYTDFTLWQNKYVESEECRNQLAFWKEELSGIPDVLELPLDHHRPKIQTYNGSEYHFTVDSRLKDKLMAFSKSHNSSLSLSMLTAWAVILYRYSSQEDFVIGFPVANRMNEQIASMTGVFINSLPMRFAFQEGIAFSEAVDQTTKKFLKAYENQEIPFERLVEELNVKRNMSYPPVFQVIFNFLSVYQSEYQLDDVLLNLVDGERGSSQVDLTLTARDHGSFLDCFLEYNTDLFDRETIVRLAGHYLTLLSNVLNDGNIPVKKIPILTDPEINLLLKEWNSTQVDYPSDRCLHRQFELQVSKTPDFVAIEDDKESVTYAELNSRANRLARYLFSRGAGEDKCIAICVERGIDFVTGMLAVAKTGAAYLPLDPIYPKARLGAIIEDAKPIFMISEASILDKLPDSGLEIIRIDRKENFMDQPETNLPYGNYEKTAFILYTSGSTGKPKGVKLRHDGTINVVRALGKKFRITTDDIVLGVTTVAFDVAEMDIYLPLLHGAKLVIGSQETMQDIDLLKKKLQDCDATILLATPVTYKMLIMSSWEGKKNLKILSGGEGFPRELAGELLKKVAEVYNGYAPTETSIYSLMKKVEPADTIGEGYLPLGRPLDNNTMYILNSMLVPVPVGVAGELYIGGDGLSNGYNNLPEMTAERFIPDIFSGKPGARLYKSGDLVKYQPDGTIVFLNRIDFQVKIRGFRVEVGEIESVLSQNALIKENVVVVREDASHEKTLVAYYVTNDHVDIDFHEIRQYLKEKLPDYMIPSAFVKMEQFPLTSTLKVDRKALPDPQLTVGPLSKGYVAPSTATEQKLAKLWTSLLHHKKIGIHDDFFEIGGQSMIAVSMVVRIEKEFGIRLPLATFFERSTIFQLGELIDKKEVTIDWRSLVPIRTEGKRKPLFLVHGLGLNVLLYTTIIKYLDPDQPVYGLQAKGMNGVDEPLETIEEIASYYISEIRTVDPEGPYYLAGFSLGGRIAYEMARQLTEMGKEVGFLGVLDATADGSPLFMPFVKREIYRLNYIRHYISWNIASFFREPNKSKLDVIRRRWHGLELRMKGIDFKVNEDEKLSRGKKSDLPKYMRKVYKMNRRADRRYVVKPYKGRVHLFKAEKQTFYLIDPEHYNWDKVAKGGVVVYQVPGEHSSTFAPPNDKYFATILQNCLDGNEV
jgi:amino acid adenylation domain-containing protein